MRYILLLFVLFMPFVALKSQDSLSLAWDAVELDEVTVVATGVDRLKRSAFNAVGIDTRGLQNSSKSLADALKQSPGVKLREMGGVGSDMNLTLDGFSGKHVKVFIDGVPQEGVGASFNLGNIPAGFSERIEIYKGVVPVEFGADALGGVINIVTPKRHHSWHADASYSFGSFNTHKSNLSFSQHLRNGFRYEVNAFQNYSDNSYRVDAPIFDFDTQHIDMTQTQRVKRFNDTYHNEAIVAKVGWHHKKWADRLVFGATYSQYYKEIQTGVRQKTVYGQKHRRGYALMPSVEYRKNNFLLRNLTLTATANYNRNITTNVDTASVRYNWLGEYRPVASAGEQSHQYAEAVNNNWNATANLRYYINEQHTVTLNNVFSAFDRRNASLLYNKVEREQFGKTTRKNIAGLSYRYIPSDLWNVSLFAKHYTQHVSGPIAVDANASAYEERSRSLTDMGYGAALSIVPLREIQLKLSYEKAYRLPTIEEMFGDEDLESGSVMIRPESSHNVNLSVSYSKQIKKHKFYAEGGVVYRNTHDYIQRSIAQLSGGKEGAFYQNYGKVKTLGGNLSVRYNYGKKIELGGSFTHMDVKDNERMMVGTKVENPMYGVRMPNVPYQFADFDASYHLFNVGGKGNRLSFTYENHYLHSFSYYSEGVLAVNSGEYVVPTQFSHNLAVNYSLKKGKYNLSLECKNLTDAKLYDNFSLQKAGRAFYGKVRVAFGK